jgi:glycosyltransferase involved in cell wall biosynthesis
VVTDGENGLLVPVRDGNAVADALERLLTDKPLRLRMGRAGRQRAEREWAASVVISRMLQYYTDTLR